MIAFEGCLAAGKTALTTWFSRKLGHQPVYEPFEVNPFLEQFYAWKKNPEEQHDVLLETELTFLLLHYSELKKSAAAQTALVSDFVIEKDLVYARLNLPSEDLEIFEHAYERLTLRLPRPFAVIYIDVSPETVARRILQRGRSYELNTDPDYIVEFHEKIKAHFLQQSDLPVHVIDGDNITLQDGDETLAKVEEIIAKQTRALE